MMADNITFDTISGDTPLGGVFLEIDPSAAISGPAIMEHKVLLIGQKLDSSEEPLLVPKRLLNADDASAKYGQGSVLHCMSKAMQNVFNSLGMMDVYAIAVENTGVAASATITVAGSAVESKVLNIYVGGIQHQITVTSGDSAVLIAEHIQAVLAQNADLPVTAAVSDAVVTLTAKNAGDIGNGLEVAWQYYDGDSLPNGITVNISGGSGSIGQLSGGSGAPVIANALAAVSEEQFYTIICPYNDDMNWLQIDADMTARWGGMNMKTGHIFSAMRGTHAQLSTFGEKRNSAHGSCLGLKNSPTWVPELATAFGLTCEWYGSNDPALPLKSVAIPGVLAPRSQDRFIYGERALLVKDGISTVTIDTQGTVLLERVVTYYQKNALGLDDRSLMSLETKWTVDYYRYVVRARIAAKWPRHKLVNNGTNIAPGQKFVTPNAINDEITAIERDLEEMGIVEDVETSKKNRIVVRSKTDMDRVNAVLPPNIVNQFRTFAAAVQYRL